MTDVESRLRALVIETPSWGYGDSGTRFGVFPQPGRPRDVFERVDDAAEVHRLTGTAGAVALHFPWDAVDDYGALREHIEARGLRVGAVNPNLFQDPDYKLGSITHPDARVREKAVAHLLECIEIATALGSTAQSLWLADGTNYPGQDDLRERRERMLDALGACTRRCPPSRSCSSSTSSSSPRSTPPTSPTGARRCSSARSSASARACWSTSATTRRASNVEQIVALLAAEGRLGGFHFNNRKYADDDLIVGSVNPFELFLVFCELAAGGALPRLTIDQSHNVEAKVEAMVLSVVNLQEAYAKALIVDREALRAAQQAGDVLGGHEALLDAYKHRRAPAVRAGARGARRGRGPDRGAARLRLRRARRRASADPGHGVHDEHRRRHWSIRRGPLAGRRRARGRRRSRARARLEPAGRRPRRLELRRRQHVGQGHRGRPHRPRARRHVGQGLGQRPRHDGAGALHRRCGSRRCCR